MAYVCAELSGNTCVTWVETVALEPLTMAQVSDLLTAISVLLAVAFGAGILVRMLLTSYASRHGG